MSTCIRGKAVSFLLATALWALSSGVLAQNGEWQGVVTRTMTFDGTTDSGSRLSYHRVDRWTNFMPYNSLEDGSSAFFDTTWSMEEQGVEVDESCTVRMEASGTDSYAMAFDINPLDEVSYLLYSSMADYIPEGHGTNWVSCRDEAPYDFSYDTIAYPLPPVPFEIPADMLPPGMALPPFDTSIYGPAVLGKLDPADPFQLRGSSSAEVDGYLITLTWDLRRPGGCDEAEARELIEREADRLGTADPPPAESAPELAPVKPAASGEPPARSRSGGADDATAGAPVSPAGVAGALDAALSGQVALTGMTSTDAGGMQQFAVRLSRDGGMLPTLAYLEDLLETTCVEPDSLEAARTLLLGSVQWLGNSFRINLRKVDVETAVIIGSVAVQGVGGAGELEAAVQHALSNFLALP